MGTIDSMYKRLYQHFKVNYYNPSQQAQHELTNRYTKSIWKISVPLMTKKTKKPPTRNRGEIYQLDLNKKQN